MDRPLNEWYLKVINKGKVSAKYVTVQIIFYTAFFETKDLEGWTPSQHENAMGWYGFQWKSDVNIIVPPNFPINLPVIDFGVACIETPLDKLTLNITLVADGFYKNYERSVQIIK